MAEVKNKISTETSSAKNNPCTNCGKPSVLKCPKCVQLKLDPSYYCSQDCFKSTWNIHKLIHELDNNVKDLFPFFSYSGKLRAYPQTPRRTVPDKIARPDYATDPHGIAHEERRVKKGDILVLNDEEIEEMRIAGRLGREVLDEAARAIDVGVTTDEIDRVVHEACIVRECYPSPLNYYQFPKSCCTSVNEIVCHGIPDLRPLENGDLCNVDVTVCTRAGYHGDLNETFFVGDKVSETDRRLVQVTYECLQKAIEFVQPGKKYRDIGKVIQKHANANGFSVVRTFCGHGINKVFHTCPTVPHYAGNKTGGIMKPGNTFTIEPMINVGVHDTYMWPDDWTAATKDGRHSAQFEQTLLVTETGCEILTQRASGRPWFMDQLEKSYKS